MRSPRSPASVVEFKNLFDSGRAFNLRGLRGALGSADVFLKNSPFRRFYHWLREARRVEHVVA